MTDRLRTVCFWLMAFPLLLVFGGSGVGGKHEAGPPPPPPEDKG